MNEVGAISASVNDDDYGTQKGGERIEFIINYITVLLDVTLVPVTKVQGTRCKDSLKPRNPPRGRHLVQPPTQPSGPFPLSKSPPPRPPLHLKSIMVTILPNRGTAKIKSVLSGDTVVLLGRPGADGRAPEVTFTFERVTAPRMASKANNNVDDPGAFSSREWLRNLCVGKTVTFETR